MNKSFLNELNYINYIYFLFIFAPFCFQLGCSGGAGGSVKDLSSFETPQPCNFDSIILNPCSVKQTGSFIADNFGSDLSKWSNLDSSNGISVDSNYN